MTRPADRRSRPLTSCLSTERVVKTCVVAALEKQLMDWHKTNAVSQQLASIPGIGPIIATAIAPASVAPRGPARSAPVPSNAPSRRPPIPPRSAAADQKYGYRPRRLLGDTGREIAAGENSIHFHTHQLRRRAREAVADLVARSAARTRRSGPRSNPTRAIPAETTPCGETQAARRPGHSRPIVGMPPCCARVANGQAAAVAAVSVKNLRRFIQSPRWPAR